MKIDWNNMPDGIASHDLPNDVDYTDPTHVPLMVADAIDEIGLYYECLTDDEYIALSVAAIDAMPLGRSAIDAAIQRRCYELAEEGGWLDCVFDPATGKYPGQQ